MILPDGLVNQCLHDATAEVMEKYPSIDPMEDEDVFTKTFRKILKTALIELGNDPEDSEDYAENLKITVEKNACEL